MTRQGVLLAVRIEAELKDLAQVVDRAIQAWKRAAKQQDDYYLDSVALNLHSFYSGLERIFEKLATTIDGALPSTPNWHQELLVQMQTEIPLIRPAIISSQLQNMLEDYRGFRHVVRNVYTFHLKPEKLKPLVDNLDHTFKLATEELSAFAKFLNQADE